MADTKITALTIISDPQTADEFAIIDDPGGTPLSRSITFESVTKRNIVVPCTLEVAQGIVAYPHVRAMTGTIAKKITGIVLPDGASIGIINFKCVIPEDLHTTPAMSIRVRFLTLTADTDHAVRLTVRTVGIAVNEDMDIGMTSETEVTAECANADDTMNEAVVNIDLTTDWVAGDTMIGLLERAPADPVDDFAGDILVVGIELLVDVVGSA